MFLQILYGVEILPNLLERFKLNKNARNSNIELLRIVLMFMVILLHFNNQSMGGAFNYVSNLPLNKFILYFFESLSICAVNCFMIISGYFLAYNKTVKLSKILDLLFIVILYNLFDLILAMALKEKVFSVKSLIGCFIPSNYFAIFYIVTYIFSPFIALIFDNTTTKTQNIFMLLIFSVFVLIPTFIDIANSFGINLNGISPISTEGNGAGYTIVQFFIALTIGIYLRRNNIRGNTSLLILVYVVSSLLMTLFIHKVPSLYNYCSVFNVINGICLFLLFNKLNFKNNFVNFTSKSVFAIFCIHTHYSINLLWKKHFILPEYIGENVGKMIICMIVCVAVMFVFCLVIDIIVRYTVNLVKNKILSKMPVLFSMKE